MLKHIVKKLLIHLNYIGKEKINNKNFRKGYTLVEAMVTAILFAIIFGASLHLLLAGYDSWQVNTTKVELQQDIRTAMDWIKEDLTEGGLDSIVNVSANGNWYTSIEFRKPSGISAGSMVWNANTTTYFLDTDSKQIQRNENGTIKTIAQNFSALQFRRLSSAPNIVEIAMAAQKQTPKGRVIDENMSFSIQLRN
jgi:type II secretory pathway pseudopilin PulG